MSNYIPIVSQDDEPTMVVRPFVPPPPPAPVAAALAPIFNQPAPKPKKSAPKQVDLHGRVLAIDNTKTVDVKAHTRANGTYVTSHSRTIKVNKSSKSAKASKPTKNSKKINPAFKKTSNYFPPAHVFQGMDDETAKFIKSMMIDDLHKFAKGDM